MQINPYLNFNGQCEAAFKFYEQALGGKIAFRMTWGEMPGATEQFPPEMLTRIMHIHLSVGDQAIMGADSPPDQYKKPVGLNVSIHVKDSPTAERIFNALAEGGTTTMPFQKTFWSSGFGMCVDQFGIPWMVNTQQPGEH
ncbi:MAG: PhnB protein [Blastocatellia bacterium]|nr:PhnB protein [Blastocatellia bacterium]